MTSKCNAVVAAWLGLVFAVASAAPAGPPLPSPFQARRPLPPPHGSVIAITPRLPASMPYVPEIEVVPYNPDAEVYETEGVTVDIRAMVPDGRLSRLNGPTYRWPGCGHSWCMMCVGIHLRSGSHGESRQDLTSIGSRQWLVQHDNLHNSGEAGHTHSVASPRTSSTAAATRSSRRGLFSRRR